MCHSLFLKNGHQIKSLIVLVFQFNSISITQKAFVLFHLSRTQLYFALRIIVLSKRYLCSRPQGFHREENNVSTRMRFRTWLKTWRTNEYITWGDESTMERKSSREKTGSHYETQIFLANSMFFQQTNEAQHV